MQQQVPPSFTRQDALTFWQKVVSMFHSLIRILRLIHTYIRLDLRGYILTPITLFFLHLSLSNLDTFRRLQQAAAYVQEHTDLLGIGKSINQLSVNVALGFYMLLALVFGVCFLYTFTIVTLILYRNHRIPRSHGAAHFARPRELHAAHLLTNEREDNPRFPLGKTSLEHVIGLTHQQQEGHVLLIGDEVAATARVFLPALEQEEGHRSLLVLDINGVLAAQHAKNLQDSHTCYFLDLERPQMQYNPLFYIRSVEQALAFAECMISNTEGKAEHGLTLKLLLAAVVLHLTTSDPVTPLVQIAGLLTDTELARLYEILTQSPSMDARKLAGAFFHAISKEQAGLLVTELVTRLFVLYELEQATSTNDVHFMSLNERPSVLFLRITQAQMKKYQPLLACLIMQFAECMSKRHQPRPVACYLPQVTSIGKIPHFAHMLTQIRECVFLMSLSSFGQLEALYGHADMEEIRNQVATHVVFSGCRDADYYTGILGIQTVYVAFKDDKRGLLRQIIEGPIYTEEGRPLLTSEQIRSLPAQEILILHKDTPPIKAEKLS